MTQTPSNQEASTAHRDHAADEPTPDQEVIDLLGQIADLKSANTGRMRIRDRPRFFTLLGEASQSIRHGDLKWAELAIRSAERLLGGSTNAVARAYYLGAALSAGLLAAAAMWSVYATDESCTNCACGAFARACFCMGMGTLGAGCSVIFRASTLAVEPGAGKVVLALEAAARVLTGTLSGFLLYLVTRSNLVFSADAIQSAPFPGHLLFAFAAGYVERFIPNVADSLQNSGLGSDRNTQPEGDKAK